MTLDLPHCILCPTPPPLTGEHIWPDWYSRLHPDREYELETILGDDDPFYTRADSLNLKPRVLCPDCNNRWGSTFENRVRPDIEPMSQGRGHVVSLIAARRLAAWACLKAMVAEHLVVDRRQDTFFWQGEREYLRKRAQPPDSVGAVWIGRYVGTRHEAGWVMDKRRIVGLSEDPPYGADLYAQTLAIGQLVIQILGIHFVFPGDVEPPKTVEGLLPFAPGDWNNALTRIWPPEQPVRWPPTLAFDDNGFEHLARRWHEDSPTRQPEHDSAPGGPEGPGQKTV